MTIRIGAAHAHLQTLHGGIDIAHHAAASAFFAHDVPGLQRLS